MKKYLIAILLAVGVLAVAGWFGYDYAKQTYTAQIEKARADGEKAAREEEAERNKNMVLIDKRGYDEFVKKSQNLEAANASFSRTIASLRNQLADSATSQIAGSPRLGYDSGIAGLVCRDGFDDLERAGNGIELLAERGRQCAVKVMTLQEIVRADRRSVD